MPKYRLLELIVELYELNSDFVASVRVNDFIVKMLTDVEFFRNAMVCYKYYLAE